MLLTKDRKVNRVFLASGEVLVTTDWTDVLAKRVTRANASLVCPDYLVSKVTLVHPVCQVWTACGVPRVTTVSPVSPAAKETKEIVAFLALLVPLVLTDCPVCREMLASLVDPVYRA